MHRGGGCLQMIKSRLFSTFYPHLNPISQPSLLPYCIHRREEVAQTHSQIPLHTIQSLCFGDWLSVSVMPPLKFMCTHKKCAFARCLSSSGVRNEVSVFLSPKEQQGGNQRNITKIRWAFSMEILISLTLLASLPPRCLEEQLNSTNNKMKDVETMMRFWCLWKSFRTSPSPKET